MFNAPHSLIWRDDQSKWIAREAMRDMLPESFRIKPRTGLLHALFNAGFERNRASITELVLDRTEEWRPWLRESPLRNTLEKPNSANQDRLVVAYCVGFLLWRDRLGL